MTRRATVVGSGPNGLVAAVTLARAGWDVTVVEAAAEPGGGTRSAELTLPGVTHDVCSAIHPLGLASPVLRSLPLEDHGLRWVHPDVPLGHVLDSGRSVVMQRSPEATAHGLGADGPQYLDLMRPLVDARTALVDTVLGQLDPAVPGGRRPSPRDAGALARFGLGGLRSAQDLVDRFATDEARALFAGLAAHSVLPLDRPPSGAVGLLLGILAHDVGWPTARGGSQRIADALISMLISHGGRVRCDQRIENLRELPPTDAVLLDLSPSALDRIAADRLPVAYRRSLRRFRHGPGVCKVDWALDGPVPWTDPLLAGAGTVHLGGSFEQIAGAESEVWAGRHARRPYVLLAQQTRFDPSRIGAEAPPGLETVWAYCHTPFGSTADVSGSIASMVEDAAPGFRDRILATHVMTAAQMQEHNANLVGGDITGGIADLRQTFARPVASRQPWRTPAQGVYLCSASTPPGGGVHGMCGWHAARCVLADSR